MTTEKRTVSSEIREFLAEIRAGFQTWRQRKPAGGNATRNLPSEETAATQANEIIFTPIPLEMNRLEVNNLEADISVAMGSGANGTAAGITLQRIDGKSKGMAMTTSVCPVTRQTLYAASKIYQCRQCGIYYSTAGWEFLLQNAKGQCCGCRSVKTVLPVVRVR